MHNFVVNGNGYFFDIRFSHVPLKGIEYFDTAEEMYARVSEVTGQDVEELETMEFVVTEKGDEIVITDPLGGKEYIDWDDFEKEINDYVL